MGADKFCLGVSIASLGVALLLSNAVFQLKYAWILGWIGCLISSLIGCFSPEPRTREDAVKLFGFGVCAAFYVTKCGFGDKCIFLFCDLPLEVLVLLTFSAVKFWFWLEATMIIEASIQIRHPEINIQE